MGKERKWGEMWGNRLHSFLFLAFLGNFVLLFIFTGRIPRGIARSEGRYSVILRRSQQSAAGSLLSILSYHLGFNLAFFLFQYKFGLLFLCFFVMNNNLPPYKNFSFLSRESSVKLFHLSLIRLSLVKDNSFSLLLFLSFILSQRYFVFAFFLYSLSL